MKFACQIYSRSPSVARLYMFADFRTWWYMYIIYPTTLIVKEQCLYYTNDFLIFAFFQDHHRLPRKLANTKTNSCSHCTCKLSLVATLTAEPWHYLRITSPPF